MKINKGTLLQVRHTRKGSFIGRANKDFDTEKDEFYPIRVEGEPVEGITTDWEEGDLIPCRKGLCTVHVYHP